MTFRPRYTALAYTLTLAVPLLTAPHRVAGQDPLPPVISTRVGPFAVGFRALVQYDYSRTYHRDYDLAGDTVTGERARPIQTSVWYPAVHRAGATPMRYADYLALSALEEGQVRLDSARRRRTLIKAAADWEWSASDFDRLIAHSTIAYADAAPAPGRFPVVIYGPSFDAGSWENWELCELLASHGYVVVASPALGAFGRWQTTTLESVDAEARDIEFLIGYSHTLAHVDPAHLAVMGYSWGGLADVIVALRNPGIGAVVALDGSIRYWQRLIKAEPYGDPRGLTAPFLFLGQAPISPDTARKYHMTVSGREFPFYDSVRYADAYFLTFEKMHHGNFGGAGNLLATDKDRASWVDTTGVRGSYAIVENYVLQFLNGYLKGDPAGKAFLMQTPESNGAPAGWVTASTKSGRSPHPDVGGFVHYVRGHGGWSQANEAVTALRQNDSAYTLPEQDLSALAQADLDDKHYADAIAKLKVNVLLHPTSVEALDGLAAAYVTANDTAQAVATFKQSLAIDSTGVNATTWLARLHRP
jgi:dienelactone hydrolase